MPPKRKRSKKPLKKRKKRKQKKDEINFAELETSGSSSQVVDVPPYQLVNVVSTCSLGVVNIDLRNLALEKNFLEFNPLTFAVRIYF